MFGEEVIGFPVQDAVDHNADNVVIDLDDGFEILPNVAQEPSRGEKWKRTYYTKRIALHHRRGLNADVRMNQIVMHRKLGYYYHPVTTNLVYEWPDYPFDHAAPAAPAAPAGDQAADDVEDDDDEEEEEPPAAAAAAAADDYANANNEVLAIRLSQMAEQCGSCIKNAQLGLANSQKRLRELAAEVDDVLQNSEKQQRMAVRKALALFHCALCDMDQETPIPSGEKRLLCPAGHAVCQGCLDSMLSAKADDLEGQVEVCCPFSDDRSALVPECCRLQYADTVLCQTSASAYGKYVQATTLAKAEEDAKRQREEERARGDAGVTFSEIRNKSLLKTPCCDVIMTDFDGCCDVRCSSCNHHFCAWCFNTSHSNLHAHLGSCALNPSKGYYANTEALKKQLATIWEARAYRQMVQDPQLSLNHIQPSFQSLPVYD
jgi:hypothetical protein